jgi:hypothetical protein
MEYLSCFKSPLIFCQWIIADYFKPSRMILANTWHTLVLHALKSTTSVICTVLKRYCPRFVLENNFHLQYIPVQRCGKLVPWYQHQHPPTYFSSNNFQQNIIFIHKQTLQHDANFLLSFHHASAFNKNYRGVPKVGVNVYLRLLTIHWSKTNNRFPVFFFDLSNATCPLGIITSDNH